MSKGYYKSLVTGKVYSEELELIDQMIAKGLPIVKAEGAEKPAVIKEAEAKAKQAKEPDNK